MRLLGLSTRAQEMDIPQGAGGAAGVPVRSAKPRSSETLSEAAMGLTVDEEASSRRGSGECPSSDLGSAEQAASEERGPTVGEARRNGRGGLSWVSGAIENFRALAAGSASGGVGVLDEEEPRLVGAGRRGRRAWESEARGSAGGGGSDGAEPGGRGKGRLETTSELERLLEEVSSFEGRLEGLLAYRNARGGRGGEEGEGAGGG